MRKEGKEKNNGQSDRETEHGCVSVCSRLYIYIYTCVWGFGCVLPVRSASACVFDEGSTVPVVLLQDNVCQAPSI